MSFCTHLRMTLTLREGVPFCGFLIFLRPLAWLVRRVKKTTRLASDAKDFANAKAIPERNLCLQGK